MWENGSRCAVVLCFDFDAESVWQSYGLTTPTPMSRGNYGAKVGLPRVLSLLKKHDIPSTFFIPADTVRRHPDAVREISDSGHEVGHHGDVHENPANLGRDEEKRVLETGLETIERATGKRPAGYRSPSWDLSQNSIGLLEEFGFLWDSSLMGDDFQLYRVKDQDMETNIVEIPVSWELDDAPHFLFNFLPVYTTGMSSPSKVFDIWAAEFDGAYENRGVFVLTLHPQITGRWHRLQMMDEFIQYMAGHPSVWFATCSEVVSAWKGQQG